MEFGYLILIMLLDLKSKQMRKVKILEYKINNLNENVNLNKNKKKELIVKEKREIKYNKGTVELLNRIISKVKKIAKKVDFDEAVDEEDEEFKES